MNKDNHKMINYHFWTRNLVLFSLLLLAVSLPACTLSSQRAAHYEIAGRVLDPAGKPLEGAVVQFRWGKEFEPLGTKGIGSVKVRSNEEGKFLYQEAAAFRSDFWLIPPFLNLFSSKNPAATIAFNILHEDYSVAWFILEDDQLHQILKVTDPKSRGEPDLYEGFTFEKAEKKTLMMEKEEQGRKYDVGDVTLEVAPLIM